MKVVALSSSRVEQTLGSMLAGGKQVLFLSSNDSGVKAQVV
jgi:hypothetical protein